MIRFVLPILHRLAGLVPAFAPAEGPPPKRLRPFIGWALSGAWPIIALATCASLFAGMMEVISAGLLGRIIDSVAASDNPSTYVAENLWLILGYAAFFLLLRPIVFSTSAAFNGIALPPNIYPMIQSRLHRWTLGHSVSFFDNDFAGRIAQKETQTAQALTNVVSETINAVAFSVAALVGSVLLLATIDYRIALVLAAWLGLYFWMISWFIPRIRKRSAARAGARAMVTGQVVDTVTNIKTVKLFGHTKHEDDSAIEAMSVLRERSLDFGMLSTGFRLALMTVAGILPVLLVFGAVMLWRNGAASPGDIAATGAIAMRISQMTGWVSFTLMTIYSNIGEVENGMKTLTPDHDLTDRNGAAQMGAVTGEVVFDKVGFAYGRATGGVTDISLSVTAGERLGIVGASGAGKSTLVSLLLRLYDSETGVVRIDGTDVASVTQESLRRQIAMVTQETAMFNRSAFENIRYGYPDATEDQVIAAAKAAAAHEFVLELEDHEGRKGYDAHLGERGVKLSGGQRQRIALARAILKNAPILVLDEATSALDSEVEAEIQATLAEVMVGKTVIAIAHRLSTIAQMDRIIVMDQGRIAEAGGHDDLLAKGGLYAQYWSRQSGGFIGVQDAAE